MNRESPFSIHRPLTSYAKVQHWVGNLIRNCAFQLRYKRIQGLRYLDLGCGLNAHEEFINIDYLWHAGIDVCWDIRNGLPFASGSMQGIFSEHSLEHFSLPVAFAILQECRRVLAHGGILRIIVPDGGMYLDLYNHQIMGDKSNQFPYQDKDSFEGLYTPILSVNRIFYQDRDSLFGHRCMYDYQLLELLLRRTGFRSVRKVGFCEGSDPVLLIDSEVRRCESLYVEAIVPNEAAC